MSETAKMLHVNLAPGEAGRYAIVPGDPDRCELIAAHLDNPRMVTRKREFTTWEGTTANGATSYPVTIIIEDYGDLRPGMNVSAQIIGEVVPNALCIPVDAVERGNTVTVPGPGALSEDGLSVVDVTKLETKEVTLGRNDDEYIEVTDGLEEGDVVLISNQASSLMDMMMGG